jgi:hypothetical protein
MQDTLIGRWPGGSPDLTGAPTARAAARAPAAIGVWTPAGITAGEVL